MIVFAAGFIAVLLGGILVSNYPGNSWGETIGSFVHRSGMIGILLGAVLIILAYRWEQLTAVTRAADVSGRARGINAYLALVVWNVVGFAAFSLGFYLLQLTRAMSVMFLAINAGVTIICAFMITLIVWHRGFVRAYAIGVLAATVLNSFSALMGFNGMYWGNDGSFFFWAQIATVLICGLVCGGYVYLLEAARARRTSATASPTGVRAGRGD